MGPPPGRARLEERAIRTAGLIRTARLIRSGPVLLPAAPAFGIQPPFAARR